MSNHLYVFLHDQLAGTLSDIGNAKLQFQYNADYLNAATLALSQSLPLTAEPFTDERARPFFSGLLPDDQQLEGLAQHLKVSKRNTFKLLAEVGAECAGAVSTVMQLQDPITSNSGQTRELNEAELLRILSTAKLRPILGGDDSIRLSLAGAQAKLAVRIKGGKVFLSSSEQPSTHILKPPSKFIAGLVENENFCMELAERVGIDVPNTNVLSLADTKVYQIRRYDRQIENDATHRVHQEDFCQALSIVPENKYEFEGGPSLQNCNDLILNVSSRPALDNQEFLKRVVFNYLIGNNDAHAKNFSLLYKNKQCRLAPAYDLVSTAIYSELNQNMAMKIGGRKKAADLQLRHWHSLVPNTETSKSSFKSLVLNLCSKTKVSLSDPTLDQPQSSATIEKINMLIFERLARLQTLFKP